MILAGRSPMRLRPFTSASRLVSGIRLRLPPCSSMETLVWEVTVVSPFVNGLGCETYGFSVTRTVIVPCATATVEILTARPITSVPVRSSTTTRAT